MLSEHELRDRYYGRGLSTHEIAKQEGVTSPTIQRWMEEYGIERRKNPAEKPPHVATTQQGHVICRNRPESFFLHRLVTVAEHGFDAVKDMQVHHLNCVPWDNRPHNLQLVTKKEHQNADKWGEWIMEDGEPRLYINREPIREKIL